MDNNSADKWQASIIIDLEANEYSVKVGASTEIIVAITNTGNTGDYFKVSLIGIPPSWITYSGAPALWLPAGAQEKVSFKISPPTGAEGVTASYFARVQVVSQSTPENQAQQEIQLKIQPAEVTPVAVTLRSELMEFRASAGAEIKIPITIANRSPETESYGFSIEGVPASWLSSPLPVVTVAGWVEKKVEINLHVPTAPSVQTGSLPIKIITVSQKDPQNTANIELKLILAAFESQGRVGVMLPSVQFSTAPGESLNVPISVINRGLAADTFRLGVEGIPASWVSTAAPSVILEAGERKVVSLTIRPTLTPASQAGRNKFIITVTSQAAPDQTVRVDCILTLAVYSQFNAELQPKEARAGQPIRVTVKNQGNTQEVYKLSCTSPDNQLVFEYLPAEGARVAYVAPTGQPQAPGAGASANTGDLTLLTIPAGETASFKFTGQPSQRPIIGGEVTYPFSASVRSNQKQSPPMQGQVISKGIVPIWVLPLALFLCIVIFGTAIVLGRQSGNQAGSATQTYLAATSQGTAISQTAAAQTAIAFEATQTFSAQIGQALSSTQTSAAATALSGGATQTVSSGTAQAFDATQTSAAGTLQAVAATQTIAAYQTSVATQQTPTFTPSPTSSPTATNSATPTATQVQIPRFGGVILFTTERDANSEIYNMDDAGHISRLTNNPAFDMQAAWSPNMQKIAFTTNRDGNNEIYMMNADGSNPINLTNNPADDQYPNWSPDGQWIVFSTNRDGNYEIYKINASTLELQNLTNNPANDTQPYWVHSTTFDPSGESVVFTSTRDGNTEIYRMKTDGTDQANLTQNPANDTMAKGSPDGSLLAFTTDRDGNQEVYTMRIDGSNQANLTQNPSNDFGPCWAPNQAWVGFTSERDGNREVYIIKPNTGEVFNLTSNPSQDVITDWR